MTPPLRLSLALLVLAAASLAQACQIPVFRYALERWPAEPYDITLFHQGPLKPAEQAAVHSLKQAEESIVNLKTTLIDLSAKPTDEQRKLWQAQSAASIPWLLVRYPGVPGEMPPVYAGPLTADSVRNILDSPARRELVRRISAGESAVWVFIESGNKSADDSAATLLQSELDKAIKTLQLPDLNAEDDGPKLLTNLPLKLAFSILRVGRTDPAERTFASMLLNSEKDLAPGPAIFPIFGRGRVLGGLSGQLIAPEQIAQGASFICGPCSCQVKGLNPGFDLLLAADWDSILDNRVAPAPAPAPAFLAQADPPTTQPATPAVGALSWPFTAILAAAIILLFAYLAWRTRTQLG